MHTYIHVNKGSIFNYLKATIYCFQSEDKSTAHIQKEIYVHALNK